MTEIDQNLSKKNWSKSTKIDHNRPKIGRNCQIFPNRSSFSKPNSEILDQNRQFLKKSTKLTESTKIDKKAPNEENWQDRQNWLKMTAWNKKKWSIGVQRLNG